MATRKRYYRTTVRIEDRVKGGGKEVLPAGTKLQLSAKEAESFGLHMLEEIAEAEEAEDVVGE